MGKFDANAIAQDALKRQEQHQQNINQREQAEQQQRTHDNDLFYRDPEAGEYKRQSVVMSYDKWEQLQAYCKANSESVNGYIMSLIMADLDRHKDTVESAVEKYREAMAAERRAQAEADKELMAFWWNNFGKELYRGKRTDVQQNEYGWMLVNDGPITTTYRPRGRYIVSGDGKYKILLSEVKSARRAEQFRV